MKTSTILIGAAVAVAGYFAYQHFAAPAKATTANAAASTQPLTLSGAYASARTWLSGFTSSGSSTTKTTSTSTSSSSPPESTERVAMANAGGVDITSWPEVAA